MDEPTPPDALGGATARRHFGFRARHRAAAPDNESDADDVHIPDGIFTSHSGEHGLVERGAFVGKETCRSGCRTPLTPASRPPSPPRHGDDGGLT